MQEAFREHHGLQCGYCTPGMVMAAVSLLAEHDEPTEAEVREGLEGNLCRCTGLPQHRQGGPGRVARPGVRAGRRPRDPGGLRVPAGVQPSRRRSICWPPAERTPSCWPAVTRCCR